MKVINSRRIRWAVNGAFKGMYEMNTTFCSERLK
jgi:hypothetical protein